MEITVKSYFSGAGGMDLGLSNAGLNIIFSLEIDKTRVNTLKKNFNHEILFEDITKKLVLEQPKAYVHVFTFPCKKYSAAADIKGTRTGDDLFLHAFRHVVLEQPEMWVIENVPGLKKFKVVMEAFENLPDYYVKIICPIDTLDFGLPQKRPRLIIFGSKKNFDPEKPKKTKQLKIKDILETNPEIEIPKYFYNRLNGNYRDKPIVLKDDSIAPTCVAHYGKDKSTRVVVDKKYPEGVRPLTVKEYARLQGFPDSYFFYGSESAKYKQIGDAVSPVVGEWIGNQINNYFRTSCKKVIQ